MRASLISVILLTATSAINCPAWAAEPSHPSSTQPSGAIATTHVLGFAANDHFEQASALTKAIRQVLANATNAKLGEGEFSLEVLTAALGCNDVPDNSCLKKITNKTGARRFIWGTLSLDGQKVKAELHLYEDGRPDTKTQFSYQSTLTDSMDADLQVIAAKAVSDLMTPLTYKVLVRAHAKEGKVLVDGKPAGELSGGQATLETTSGEHVFRLETDAQNPIEETVRVRVDGSTKVRLDPADAPASANSATAPAGKNATTSVSLTEPPALPATGSNAQRTWGYITLGAGGVLLAAGGLAAGRLYMLSEDKDFKAYRQALRSNEDACTEADRNRVIPGAMTPSDVRSSCSEGKTLEVAQIVLLAGGVVAVGTGVTLLLTSKSKPNATNSRFEPRVVLGKDRTDLGFVMHF